MAKAPTLLFCVGATKASTTWLYKFLAGHPDCHLRSIKELHYFDRLDAGTTKSAIAGLQSDLDLLRSDMQQSAVRRMAKKIKDIEEWCPVLQRPDDAAYLSYLMQGLGTRQLVADVTPSYALLTVDRLRRMAAILPDVRFVYLMRDPLARLWSHVRMSASRRIGDLQAEAGSVLDAVLKGQQADIQARGDYRAVVGRLHAAVDPSRLLVMFQEVLLTIPGIRQLCAFLGIADHPADFTNRVHQGPRLTMSGNQAMRARVALRAQYDFAADRLGTLPDAWLGNIKEGMA